MKWKKGLLIFIGSVVAVLAIAIAYVFLSPYPVSMLVRNLFEGGMAVAPDNYDDIAARVSVENDISYESEYGDGFFDLLTPKNSTEALPVVVWVHGGAFVGGDKADVTEYAVQVADQGFVVANMNYERAPEATFPTPVKQVEELLGHLIENASQYNIDPTRIFLAGDSAGAHIIGQYALIQSNETYAELVDIAPSLDVDSISGVLLFCGPYDVKKMTEYDSFAISFVLRQAGWAYFGVKDWADSELAVEMTLVNYVSEDYPPTFITDGNSMTFTDHGIDMADKLRAVGVSVTDVFYDIEEVVLGHEYQFVMDNEYAHNTFNELIVFMKALVD